MSAVVKVSPSAIEAFECQRKWGARYLEGIRPAPSQAAELGTELHKIGEDYQNTGKYPDRLTKAGDLFVAGLPWTPPPLAGGAEGTIEIAIDGVNYLGIIDYRGDQVPGINGRVVFDYKTSSNPAKYGLWTKEAFLNNPAAVLYSTYDILTTGDKEARLRWLYYWTKTAKPKVKPSDTVLTYGELEDNFEEVVGNKAKQIVRLKMLAPHWLELDPNTEVCTKYGGCPHRDICRPTLSAGQIIAGQARAVQKEENQKMSGLLSKMKAQASNGTEQAAPAPTRADLVNPPEAQQAVTTKPLRLPATTRTQEAPPELTERSASVAKVLRVIADLIDGGA